MNKKDMINIFGEDLLEKESLKDSAKNYVETSKKHK